MRLTHLGHSCLLVETGGGRPARVLLDPGAFSGGFEELTGLDAVVVTHAHPDHVDAERLAGLLDANDGAALLAEPSLAADLHELGAQPLHPGENRAVGGADVEAVGGEHALIHEDVPRVGNIGLVLRAPGEPVLFHPGDSYAVVPAGVEVLALPLSAPWAAEREAVDFVRAVRPRLAVPVHDALLSPAGRAVYLRNLRQLLPEGTELHDTGGSGVVEL